MRPGRAALLALALPGLALAGLWLAGAAKDAGTGYRLENVKVLDPDMRLEDARRYMIRFNDALGVQCRDCHDLQDFGSDAKKLKLAARDMMRMEIAINEKWFPGAADGKAVTCWTCHRGSLVPPVVAGALPDSTGRAALDDAALPEEDGAPADTAAGGPDPGSSGK